MSRRRGEFEHRTSIFEGAYRAWSHIGGVDPMLLTSVPASDLDPLSNPHKQDSRVTPDSSKTSYVLIDASGKKRLYPYEPLPRTGLAHPFIQAIISPWLGPDAEQDDIQLGLTTLRTWWQHRRKGESSSAKQALGSEKMRSVVEGYTRHFFNLAHSMIMNDGEQPPRSLATRIKEVERNGIKLTKKRDPSSVKTPMEPYFLDVKEPKGSCCSKAPADESGPTLTHSLTSKMYGDPNKMPVVFVSDTGDIQIAMTVSGITCNHCVKIIETVLKGVKGSPSPINGLIDAAADRELSSVIIKITKSSFAKRIAFEATENLKMVGYESKIMEMGIIDPVNGMAVDLASLSTAFDVVAATDAKDVFDWNLECTCPDNGIVKTDCPRHSQMNKRTFEAFDERQKQVKEFMAGCGKKHGMPCTCGSKCKCKSGKCCSGKGGGCESTEEDTPQAAQIPNLVVSNQSYASQPPPPQASLDGSNHQPVPQYTPSASDPNMANVNGAYTLPYTQHSSYQSASQQQAAYLQQHRNHYIAMQQQQQSAMHQAQQNPAVLLAIQEAMLSNPHPGPQQQVGNWLDPQQSSQSQHQSNNGAYWAAQHK